MGKTKKFYDDRSFLEAIKEELWQFKMKRTFESGFQYINKGLYAKHLKHFFAEFDNENLLLIESKELKTNPKNELNRIYNFLGVKDSGVELIIANKSLEYTTTDDDKEATKLLREYFHKENELLYEHLGVTFNW